MKRWFRILLNLLLMFVVALVLFYFWGSSSKHAEAEYAQLIENDFPANLDDDSTFRIVTYNIGYLSGMLNNEPVEIPESVHSENLRSVRASLQEVDADILCFQEIDYASNRSFYVNQQDTIAALGYNYVFQAVNWDKRYVPFPYFPVSIHFGEVYSGQSVISKHPIKDPERLILQAVESDPFYRTAFYLDRLAQVCKIEIGGKEVIVINVHVEAYDTKTQENQCDYLAGLYMKYKDDYPVLLVGDFNTDPQIPSAAVHRILKLEDIGAACSNIGLAANTFPSDEPSVRIDYVFYNRSFIRELNSKVLTSFGQSSDHLPILFEFGLL